MPVEVIIDAPTVQQVVVSAPGSPGAGGAGLPLGFSLDDMEPGDVLVWDGSVFQRLSLAQFIRFDEGDGDE